MDYMAFLQHLEQRVGMAYLFHGEEEHVKNTMAEKLTDKALEGGIREMNLLTLEGTAPADDIIAGLEPMPMLGERRMVWVKDWLALAAKTKEDTAQLDKLLAYLQNPAPHAVLLLFCHGALEAKSKGLKELAKHLEVVDFALLGGSDAQKWAVSAAKSRGVKLGREASEELLLRTGRQLQDVGRELDKLAAYVGQGGEVDVAAVDLLVPKTLEFTVFQMVDAVMLRQGERALQMLWQALSAGDSALMVASMLARQLRLCMQAVALRREGASPQQMERVLEAPSFACRKALDMGSKAGEPWLRKALGRAVDLDWGIKSGKYRDDRLALEVLVLSMLSEGKTA